MLYLDQINNLPTPRVRKTVVSDAVPPALTNTQRSGDRATDDRRSFWPYFAEGSLLLRLNQRVDAHAGERGGARQLARPWVSMNVQGTHRQSCHGFSSGFVSVVV